MSESILDSTKKMLGIAPDYTVFDQDIILNINSVLSTLDQLGIGPEGGYSIVSSADTWDEFIGADKRLNNVKLYVYLSVRLVFDPPTSSFVLTALKEQIEELKWRINVYREFSTYPEEG